MYYHGLKVNGGLAVDRRQAEREAASAVERLIVMNHYSRGEYLRSVMESGGI